MMTHLIHICALALTVVGATPDVSHLFDGSKQGYIYEAPSNQINSQINAADGYHYPRPVVSFDYPRPTTRPTTTRRPVFNEPQRVPDANNVNQVFSRPASTRPTTLQPFVKEKGYDYSKPQIPFSNEPNNQVDVFIRPTTTRPATYPPQAFDKDTGYDYSKPSKPFPTARPAQTSRITTTRRPAFNEPQRIPDSGSVSPTFAKPAPTQTGYDYSKPVVQTTRRPVFNEPQRVSDSNNANPTFSKPYPTQVFNKDTGYDYSRPAAPFPSARPVSTTRITTTRRPTFNEQQRIPDSNKQNQVFSRPVTTRPTTLQPFDQEKGYDYSKPQIPFNNEPNNQVDVFVRPTQAFDKDTGYDYSRPAKPFSTVRPVDTTKITTTRRPVFNEPQRQPASNNVNPTFSRPLSTYPTQAFNKDTGYDYPKPTVRPVQTSRITTTRRPVFNEPQRLPISNNVGPTRPAATRPTTLQPFDSEKGYDYSKPQISFNNEPNNQVEVFARTSQPTTAKPVAYPAQAFNKDTGYDYSRPSKPFPTVRPVESTRITTTRRSVFNEPQRLPASNNVNPTFSRPQTTYPTQAFNKDTGYDYPKPTVRPVQTSRITTTRRPVFNEPQRLPDSNNVRPTFSRPASTRPTTLQPFDGEKGYDYSKPQIPFNNEPNNQVEVFAKPSQPTTAKPVAYPTQAFNKDTGYDYSRPSKPFPTVRPVDTTKITTTRRPVFNEPQRQPASNNVNPTFSRPQSTYPTQAFNKDTGYDYPKPTARAVQTTKITTTRRPVFNEPQRLPDSNNVRPTFSRPASTRPTTLQPFDSEKGYDYSKPQIPFNNEPNNQVEVFARPSQPTTVKPSPYPTQAFNKDTGYDYSRPSKPFSTVRPVQTTRIATTRRPVFNEPQRIPDANNGNSVFSRPLTTRPTTGRPLGAGQGYDYSKPQNPFGSEANNQVEVFAQPNRPTTARPAAYPTQAFNKDTGYDYSRPSVPFPSAGSVSTTRPVTTRRPAFNQPQRIPDSNNVSPTFARPTTLQSFNKDTGYSYKNPATNNLVNSFGQPNEGDVNPEAAFDSQKLVTRRPLTTTRRPVYNQPQTVFSQPQRAPASTQQPFDEKNGYKYPQPSGSFNFGSNNQVNTFVSAPLSTLQPFSEKTGYDYSKPQTRPSATLQTTTRQPQRLTTRPSIYNPVASNNLRSSTLQPFSEESGYSYDKPKAPFQTKPLTTFQTTRRPFAEPQRLPSANNQASNFLRIASTLQPFDPETGYLFNKPAIPFDF